MRDSVADREEQTRIFLLREIEHWAYPAKATSATKVSQSLGPVQAGETFRSHHLTTTELYNFPLHRGLDIGEDEIIFFTTEPAHACFLNDECGAPSFVQMDTGTVSRCKRILPADSSAWTARLDVDADCLIR